MAAAIDRFDARACGPRRQVGRPTPCTERAVRDLVNHLVSEGQMFIDLTVHEWDLARGSGQDESLDPEAVAISLVLAQENVDLFAGMGIFVPRSPRPVTIPRSSCSRCLIATPRNRASANRVKGPGRQGSDGLIGWRLWAAQTLSTD
jgi:hypothetical protein